MRFDHRLIPPDDAPLQTGGEIDLPDDLAALAERLRDDAAQLAASYPAGREQVLPGSSATRPKSGRWLAVCGIGAAAAAAAVMVAITVQSRLPEARRTVAPPPATSMAADAQLLPVAEVPEDSAPVVTTVSLTNLSGPELEAVLDLWRRDPEQPTSVSF